jgi:hypothetical protein
MDSGVSSTSVDWLSVLLDKVSQLEVLLDEVIRLYGFSAKAQAVDRIERVNMASWQEMRYSSPK